MEIHQIAHRARDPSLRPEERERYQGILRELSMTLQNLRLYENVCEGYRRALMQKDLRKGSIKWLEGKYSKASHAVGELKWRKYYLEQIPCFFDYEPIEEVIDPQLALPRLRREYKELVDRKLSGKTDPANDARMIYLAAKIERLDQDEIIQDLSQKEEMKLKATRELGKTLEQLSIGKISFNEARPVIKGYLDNSQN